MFNKKIILILTIILVSLFAVSAVSASDNATSDVVGVEETTDDIVSVEENQAIEQNYDEEIIGVDNGTFTALQNKIDKAGEGSTIVLENDYAYDEGFDTKGIGISKSLTINGNGHTIDAKESSRIFNIAVENVILKNIIFRNGYSNAGGAIYVEYGGLTAQNCSFYNCHAEYNGGAVYTDVNGNTFKKCNFESCYADKGSGGAIKGSSSYYDSCNFKNCWAGYYGGAIESYNINSDMLKCTFTNCRAGMYGGAVRFCKAVECKFINNNAVYPGGAICYGESYNCYFSGNSEPVTYNTDMYSYTPDEYKSPASSSTSKTVKKTTPKLTAKAKTFKKSVKIKKYTVRLTTSKNVAIKNAKVFIKIAKKTYSAVTTKKGYATFKITKLTKKGKYTSVVSFKGNKYYNAKAVKVRLVVK